MITRTLQTIAAARLVQVENHMRTTPTHQSRDDATLKWLDEHLAWAREKWAKVGFVPAVLDWFRANPKAAEAMMSLPMGEKGLAHWECPALVEVDR